LEPFEAARWKCKEKGLTQNILAEKIGISQAQISAALNGQNNTTLLRIIDLLQKEYGVTAEELTPENFYSLREITNELKKLTTVIQELVDLHKR